MSEPHRPDKAEQAWIEGIIAESQAKLEAEDALFAASEQQDDDFHAYEIRVLYEVEVDGGSDYEQPGPFDNLQDCVVAGEPENAGEFSQCMADDLSIAVTAALEPLRSHCHSLGLIRADFANYPLSPDLGDEFCPPRFFLVHRAGDADLSATSLAAIAPLKIELPASLGGRTLTITMNAQPSNATILHAAAAGGALGVGQWGGEATPDLAPVPDESRDDWLVRVSIPRERLARLVERWVACGRQPDMFRAFGNAMERETSGKPTDWLVEGVLARGVLTILAGDGSAGKTSLVHEWLSSLGGIALTRPRTVLGVEVTGRVMCAVIYGEGAAGMDCHRTECHAKVWGSSAYAERKGTREDLPALLAGFRGFPALDLLVIDPMRPFLKGDEKSSDVINEFYMPLERFAEDMNCAVVITQHVSKSGMNGKSVHDAKSAILGATAVTNRPRMVIAMDRRSNGSTVKLAPVKHNFTEEMLWVRSTEWSVWKHDSETHTLVPAETIASGAAGGELDLGLIFDAIVEQNSLGRALRRTGRHELFERKLAQLSGVSRQAIRRGVASLIEAGRVTDRADGLLAVRGEPFEPGTA